MRLAPRYIYVLVTAGWLFAVPGSAHAQNLVEGVRKYEAGDYTGAIAEWEPLARQGSADAQFNLGQVYRLGRGAPVDLARAANYYASAAKQGHIDAQGNLATLYFFSDDDPAKRNEAIGWWRSAAKAGDTRSQYMLGILLFNGDFLEKDYVQAYGWILLAVQNGLEEAVPVELKMRRHLSIEQMAQGRILSRSLVEKTDPAPVAAETIIPPPAEPAPPDVTVEEPAVPAAVTESPAAQKPASENNFPEQPALQEPAPAPPKDAASPALAGQWRLQLGSFRTKEGAEKEWQRMMARDRDLLGDLRHDVIFADLGPERGVFYRLQGGSFADRAAASARCEQMKASGLNCFVLSP